MAGVGATPSGAVVAEDIRDLQSWTGHEGRAATPAASSCLGRCAASADRAGSSTSRSTLRGDVRVARRRVELGVAERARVIMHVLLTH